jgi:Icc-related predicted phosphoesterase
MAHQNILAFTDFHGQLEAYNKAKQLISAEKPDFAVVAGDIVNHDAELAKKLLSELGKGDRPIYFIPGNMDNPDLKDWPGNLQVHPLHGRCEFVNGICLIGLGGAPYGAFKTPFQYADEDATQLLESLARNCKNKEMILISHCPPVNTRVDQVAPDEHLGSHSVRRFIENVQPILVISGHVHEAQGIDKIGITTLVNPGPAQRGHFARIKLAGGVSVSFGKLS